MYFFGYDMKALCVLMALMMGQVASASGQHVPVSQVLGHINELVKQGEHMNLKTTANLLDTPKLYDDALFSGDDHQWFYRYQFEQTSPLQEVRYRIWLDMNQGFGVVAGAVDYHFKPDQCPTIDVYETVLGVPVVTHQIPYSPDLWTGKGGSYDMHYFYLPDSKVVSVTTDGCQVGVSAHAKLS